MRPSTVLDVLFQVKNITVLRHTFSQSLSSSCVLFPRRVAWCFFSLPPPGDFFHPKTFYAEFWFDIRNRFQRLRAVLIVFDNPSLMVDGLCSLSLRSFNSVSDPEGPHPPPCFCLSFIRSPVYNLPFFFTHSVPKNSGLPVF